MTENRVTVKELCSQLLELIDKGFGDKTVELSVNYDHCDHVQPLKEICTFENCKYIDWITLRGGNFE